VGKNTTRKFNLWKPDIGEPAGTWGELVSNNFEEIDQKALYRGGDSMKGPLDMGEYDLKQGPFKQKYNSETGNWELYVNIGGIDVVFGVFEVVGDKVNFRITGQFLEGEPL
jgi:hypothetical protein